MKNSIFWDAMPCSQVEVHRLRWNILTPQSGYKKVISKNHAAGRALFLLFDPGDGGNAFIRKFSEFLPDYMASYATEEYSSNL
jgi:hypothetical protein